MFPQITVLMSVYNNKDTLVEAIISILNQTFKDFEFLIIDDHSTDNSLSILEKYAALDERIKIMKNIKNKGLGYNLNQGLKRARGKWIARMDADDIAMPDRFEKQMDFINENDVDIVGSWATEINEQGKEIGLRKCPVSDREIKKYIWTCPIIHPSVMFKRDKIVDIGSYGDERRRQDYELWFRAAKAGLKFANIPEPLIKYRYADDYFEKNNFGNLVAQAKIGLKGCLMVNAKPIAYIGVLVPVLRGMLPKKMQRFVNNMLKKVDPRGR